jgi:hypothetical protein
MGLFCSEQNYDRLESISENAIQQQHHALVAGLKEHENYKERLNKLFDKNFFITKFNQIERHKAYKSVFKSKIEPSELNKKYLKARDTARNCGPGIYDIHLALLQNEKFKHMSSEEREAAHYDYDVDSLNFLLGFPSRDHAIIFINDYTKVWESRFLLKRLQFIFDIYRGSIDLFLSILNNNVNILDQLNEAYKKDSYYNNTGLNRTTAHDFIPRDSNFGQHDNIHGLFLYKRLFENNYLRHIIYQVSDLIKKKYEIINSANILINKNNDTISYNFKFGKLSVFKQDFAFEDDSQIMFDISTCLSFILDKINNPIESNFARQTMIIQKNIISISDDDFYFHNLNLSDLIDKSIADNKKVIFE